MVRSWYMDDRSEDPQDEHILEEVDTVTLCARTGVEIWYFHPDQIQTENESLSLIKLKRDRGYAYEDEIKVEPSVENYAERTKISSVEHGHSNEEVRLVLEGSGFFDVRDHDDRWMRIHVFPGDFIILPARLHHRFIPDKQNYISVRRFFIDESARASIDRPGADTNSPRKTYIEHLYRNGIVDTDKDITDVIS